MKETNLRYSKYQRMFWFLEVNVNEGSLSRDYVNSIYTNFFNYTIKDETPKAYLLEWDTIFGVLEAWMPKNCMPEVVEEEFMIKDNKELGSSNRVSKKRKFEEF